MIFAGRVAPVSRRHVRRGLDVATAKDRRLRRRVRQRLRRSRRTTRQCLLDRQSPPDQQRGRRRKRLRQRFRFRWVRLCVTFASHLRHFASPMMHLPLCSTPRKYYHGRDGAWDWTSLAKSQTTWVSNLKVFLHGAIVYKMLAGTELFLLNECLCPGPILKL